MEIPMIDDFGDATLNRLATRYRNELNDTRPAFGNLYLLELNKPLDDFMKKDLIEFFESAIANKTKINIDDIDEILEQDIPPMALY
tara:strand:- start:13 stop:270 length:258 start_codon:yes stop_codon:yes gene_type:complete